MHSLIPYEDGFVVASAAGKLVWWDGTDTTVLATDTDYESPIQHAYHSDRVLLVNGVMAPSAFNGTLTPLTITSGLTDPDELIGVTTFKGRAIYWKSESGFYFCAVGGFQGEFSYYDVAPFSEGVVKTIFTYSTDAGDGTDDMLVVLMDSGDALMYQGDDPGDALNWQQIAKYSMPPPISIRGDCGLVGDRVILTEQGWLNFNHVVKNGNIPGGIGHKIIGLAKETVENGVNLDKWEVHYIASKGLLVVCTEQEDAFTQQVMNVRTGAWCTFSGIPSMVWAVNDGDGFYATTTKIFKYDGYEGEVDTDALPAYTQLGNDGRQRQLTGISPVLNADQTKVAISAAAGFVEPAKPTAVLDESDPAVTRAWHTKNIFDHVVSYRMATKSSGVERRWYSTQFLFKTGGPV